MHLNVRSVRLSASRLAASAAIAVGVMGGVAASQTQNPPFPLQPVCYTPPAPEADTWPVAAPDSLGSTAGVAFPFSAASLLANDTGNALLVSGIDQVSTNGGRITGGGPYIYTPPAGFRRHRHLQLRNHRRLGAEHDRHRQHQGHRRRRGADRQHQRAS